MTLEEEVIKLRAENAELVARLIDRTSAMLRHEGMLLQLVKRATQHGFISKDVCLPSEADANSAGDVLMRDVNGEVFIVDWNWQEVSEEDWVEWARLPD